MSVNINIVGWTSEDKVPMLARQTSYGSGKKSLGGGKKLVITGTMLSTGTATPDSDVLELYSEDQLDTYFGAGSEIAMQGYAALANPGVTLVCAPVAENGTAAAGTIDIVIGGTWTEGGSLTFYLAGTAYAVTVASNDVTTDVATSTTTAFSSVTRAPVTASTTLSTSTLTTKSKGVRANDYVLDVDMSAAPSGLTVTLTGGIALNGRATPFTSGAGADDVTNVLALLTTDRYDYQAWAQYDGTNLALIKAQLDSEAGPLVQHLEHGGVGSCRALATANSLSNTTLNDERMMNPWLQNGQWTPAMLIANVLAARSVAETDNPNTNYDDVVLKWSASSGNPAQLNRADIPGHSSLKSALNNGVTPLVTQPDGSVIIKRAIVSHCKTGSSYDYSTLDCGDAVVPDYISDQLATEWSGVKANNPYAGDDPATDERPLPSGIITPSRWNAHVKKVLKDAEASLYVQDVDTNLPESQWDGTANRILTACPVIARKQNHQAGVDVRQQAA